MNGTRKSPKSFHVGAPHLDHKQWQKLNRLILEIHGVHSRDDLVGLVTGSLPTALDAEQAFWREHGPVVSTDRIHPETSCQDSILALILKGGPTGQHQPAGADSRSPEPWGAHCGVFDVTALISSRLSAGRSSLMDLDLQTVTHHQIATHFFVDAHCGILVTVQNSRPFTAKQKFTLSLLREHLAIAARRHCHRESGQMVANPISGAPVFSRREKEVLPYLAKGFTNPEIADSLGISPRTVEKHVASILDKSGLDNRRMLIGLGSFSGTATRSPENG